MLQTILFYSQLILAVLLIAAVLLQQQGSGLGAGFGGGSGGSVKLTRRGPEKVLFQATVVISIVFFLVSLASVIV